MSKGIDDLLHFLVQQVALQARAGATVAYVLEAAASFYKKDDDTYSTGTAKKAPYQPDRAFLEQVWNWLLQNPCIGLLSSADEGNIAKSRHLSLAEVEQHNKPLPPDRPGTIKAGRKQAKQTSDPAELRLHTNEYEHWMAITGHGPDHRKISALEWTLLTIIAESRSKGVLQPDLVRISGQDKRSVPMRTTLLADRGYIVKRSAAIVGSNTSELFLKGFAADRSTASVDKHSWQWRRFGEHVPRIKDAMRIAKESEDREIDWRTELRAQLGLGSRERAAKTILDALSRFEYLGCVEVIRLDHKPRNNGSNNRINSLKFLRDITEEDWARFWVLDKDLTRHRASRQQQQSDEDGEDSEQDLAHRESANPPLNPIQAQMSSQPTWTPDRTLVDLLYQSVKDAGMNGITSTGNILSVTGKFYTRPLSSLLVDISNSDWRNHVYATEHLQLVRDATQLDRYTAFLFYTFQHFRDLVDLGKKAWWVVHKSDPDLEHIGPFGFDGLPSNLFETKTGEGTVAECLKLMLQRSTVRWPTLKTIAVKPLSKGRLGPVSQDPGPPEGKESGNRPVAVQTTRKWKWYYTDEEYASMRPEVRYGAWNYVTTIARYHKKQLREKLLKRMDDLQESLEAAAEHLKKEIEAKLVRTDGDAPQQQLYHLPMVVADLRRSTSYWPSAAAHTAIYPGPRLKKLLPSPIGRPKKGRSRTQAPDESAKSKASQRQPRKRKTMSTKKPIVKHSRPLKSKVGYFPSVAAHTILPFMTEPATTVLAQPSIEIRGKTSDAISIMGEPPQTPTQLPDAALGQNSSAPRSVLATGGRMRKQTDRALGSTSLSHAVEDGMSPKSSSIGPLTYEQQYSWIQQAAAPGVYIGPLCTLKRDFRGRGPKSLIAVFRSARLRDRGRHTTHDLQSSGENFADSALNSSGTATLQHSIVSPQSNTATVHVSGPSIPNGPTILTSQSPTTRSGRALKLTRPSSHRSEGHTSKKRKTEVVLSVQKSDVSFEHQPARISTAKPAPQSSLDLDSTNHLSRGAIATHKGTILNVATSPDETSDRAVDNEKASNPKPSETLQSELQKDLNNKMAQAQSFVAEHRWDGDRTDGTSIQHGTNSTVLAVAAPFSPRASRAPEENTREQIHTQASSETGSSSALEYPSGDKEVQLTSPRTPVGPARSITLASKIQTPSHRGRGTPMQVAGVRRFGGSLLAQRKQLIMWIIRENGGVFPGGKEVFYPYQSEWMKTNPTRTDTRTLTNTLKALVDAGELKQYMFNFRYEKVDRQKYTENEIVEKRIVMLPHLSKDDEKVIELKRYMKQRHPQLYVPSGVPINPKLRQEVRTDTWRMPEDILSGDYNQRSGGDEAVSPKRRHRNSLPAKPGPKPMTEEEKARRREHAAATIRAKRAQQAQTHADDLLGEATFSVRDYRHQRVAGDFALRDMRLQHDLRMQPNSQRITMNSLRDDNASEGGIVYMPSLTRTTCTILDPAAARRQRIETVRALEFIQDRHRMGLHAILSRDDPSKKKAAPVKQPKTRIGRAPAARTIDWKPGSIESRQRKGFTGFVGLYEGDLNDSSTSRSSMQPRQWSDRVDMVQRRFQNSGTFGTFLEVPGWFAPRNLQDILERGWPGVSTAEEPAKDKISQHGILDLIDKVQRWEAGDPSSSAVKSTDGWINITADLDTPTKPRKLRAYVSADPKTRRPRRPGAVALPEVSHEQRIQGLKRAGGKVDRLATEESSAKRRKIKGSRHRPQDPELDKKMLLAIIMTKIMFRAGDPRFTYWEITEKLLGGEHDQREIKKRHNLLRTPWKAWVRQTQDILEEKFLTAYEMGEVPEIDYDNHDEVDWVRLMQWAESQRLTGEKPVEVRKCTKSDPSNRSPQLPASQDELKEKFDIREQDIDARNDAFEVKVQGMRASKTRAWLHETQEVVSMQQKQRIVRLSAHTVARTWVRALAITSKRAYNSEPAKNKLQSVPELNIEAAYRDLLKEKALVVLNKGRGDGDRNVDISHTFVAGFRMRVEISQYEEALKYKQEILDAKFKRKEAENFEPVVDDGIMLALINLWAAGHITLHARELLSKPMGLLGGTYRTRSINKKLLQFPIQIRPTASYAQDSGNTISPTMPRAEVQSSADGIDMTPLPVWVDIHGNDIASVWQSAFNMLAHVSTVRPGLKSEEIAKYAQPSMEAWEIRLLMRWAVAAQLAEWMSNEEDGVRLRSNWWCWTGLKPRRLGTA